MLGGDFSAFGLFLAELWPQKDQKKAKKLVFADKFSPNSYYFWAIFRLIPGNLGYF